ncbi:MAG: hypothetical protein Q7J72_04135 [Candidatus Omnitrophota bacterium]|nr:hypothetical protein [Candidatus Omnitrophota bacterium]
MNTAESIIKSRKKYANDVIFNQNTILFLVTQYNDPVIQPEIIKRSVESRGVEEKNIHILGAKGEFFNDILGQIEGQLSNENNKGLKPVIYLHGHGIVEGNGGKISVGKEKIEYNDLREMIKILPNLSTVILDSCHSDVSVEEMLREGGIEKIVTIITTTKGNNAGMADGGGGLNRGSAFAGLVYLKGNAKNPLSEKDLYPIGEKLLMHNKTVGIDVLGDRIKYGRVSMGSMLTSYHLNGDGVWKKVSYEAGEGRSIDVSRGEVNKTRLFTSSKVKDIEVSSSIVEKTGGIAFNALPIRTEAVASSALGFFPGVKAFQGDLDAEWAQIQQVFNAGIRPSIQRLSEYTQAASASPLAGEKIDGVRGLFTDMLRRDEESQKLKPAEEALKQLLSLLESDRPTQELQLALSRNEKT